MFKKFAPIWAIIILPLAVIMFSCGEEETGPIGPTNGTDDDLSTEWEITHQTSGVETTLQEVFFDSASGHGWVVGNDGVILHTTDKGETWEQQDSGVTNILYSVYFVNENEGWVAGDAGTVLHTEDGGAMWEAQNSGVDQQLRGLFFANNSDGWAVGKGGTIINTRDGGAQWDSQNRQASGVNRINQDLEAVSFAPASAGEVVVDHGWAVGLNATIIHTTDGRAENAIWITQPASRGFVDDPLYGVFFATKNKGWVVGNLGPTVMNSSNGGQTWGNSAAVAAGSKSLYDVFFITAADGWAVGSGGKILHSPDGGLWERIETEVTKDVTTPLWGVAFIDSSEGWVVGDLGVILHIKSAQ